MTAQEVIPGMDGIVKREQPPTPMHLIEIAVSKGADADALAKLMDLQLRWEANEARKSFEQAFEVFKRNLPEIFKTKKVAFPTSGGGRTEYSHAELDKITPIITESLLAVGIVHQWRTSDLNNRTTVTCVLKGFGHTEESATLSGPPDTSGGKNSVQAIGSTTAYLQRYTLLAACGIAPKGLDDDGKTEGLPEDTILDYCIQMQDAANFAELKPMFGECWEKAKAAGDRGAQERFRKVYEQRKKEMQ
jgi:hypothetical protein